MGNLKAQVDLLRECNPKEKIKDADFTKGFCSECANSKCFRSRYRDRATKATVGKNEKLQTFVDPTTVAPSPLSHGEGGEDPWSAPSIETLHKEWDTPEQDPWSVDFSGSLNTKVGGNATIRIPGKRRK